MASEMDLLGMADQKLKSIEQQGFGLFQKLLAAKQRRAAERNFQNYKIPSAVNIMLQNAQGLASQTEIPGADIYQARAKAGASQSIESAQRVGMSSSDVLGQLSSSENLMNKFYQDIAAKGGAYYQENQAMLQGTLEKYGNYETERWKYNELMPYMQAMQRAGETDAAANANIQSGIISGMNTNAAATEIGTAQNDYNGWIMNLFGNK